MGRVFGNGGEVCECDCGGIGCGRVDCEFAGLGGGGDWEEEKGKKCEWAFARGERGGGLELPCCTNYVTSPYPKPCLGDILLM